MTTVVGSLAWLSEHPSMAHIPLEPMRALYSVLGSDVSCYLTSGCEFQLADLTLFTIEPMLSAATGSVQHSLLL